MKWRIFGILGLIGGGVLGAEEGQPNVIFLVADDLGYGELGCQGNAEIPTPNIDSIAAGGVRFTDAYVAGPNCSPSRAGLMTGRIPTRFGYEFNPIGARNEDVGTGLPAKEVTVAEMLGATTDEKIVTFLIKKATGKGDWQVRCTVTEALGYMKDLASKEAIRKLLQEQPGKFDPRDYLKPARAAMVEVVRARMEAFGQAGWADKIKCYSLADMAVRYSR